jgi:hypothetical protein
MSLQGSRAAAEEAAKEAQRQRDTKQGSLGVVLEQVSTYKLCAKLLFCKLSMLHVCACGIKQGSLCVVLE